MNPNKFLLFITRLAKKPGTVLLFILFPLMADAQLNMRDSTVSFAIFGASGAYQTPGGDLAKRFGDDMNVGMVFSWKLKSNWMLGIEGLFLFGGKVKEDQLLDNISTSQGAFIAGSGEYANLLYSERGFKTEFKLGKIFPWIGPNPNSGVFFQAGCGLLQHKIKIQSQGFDVPSIRGEYLKGYDRLTNGLSITEFIGYINFGNKRLVNFYAGPEFTQAFTQNRRSFNFDTRERDNSKRLDLLFGIRFVWMIPVYKRQPQAYYYN